MALLIAAARSETGLLRKRNEDAWRIYRDQAFVSADRGFLLAVADGMGSGRAGSEAAWMAVDQLAHFYHIAEGQLRGERTLQDLIFRSNDAITRLRTTSGTHYGMGTTLVVALLAPDLSAATVLNTGDSAAFLWRRGRLARVTTAQVNGTGELTNHLGMGPGLVIERARVQLAVGDRLLLSTDGVHGYLPEDALAVRLAGPDPEAIATALTEAANATGGKDNATALVAEIRRAPE